MKSQSYLPNKNGRTISITTKFIDAESVYKRLNDGNTLTEVIAFLDTNDSVIKVTEEEVSKYYYAPCAKQVLDCDNHNYYVEQINEEHYKKLRKEYDKYNGTRN